MFAQSLWSLAAAAFFSMMAACVKYCNDVFGPLELVFYRSLFTTLFVFITVSLRGETLKTRYPMLHLRRDVLGFASVAIWFFTLGLLPLGTNITLTYSTPLFLALNFILLALWKKEQPEWPLIGSILLGFVGIVVVMRPSFLSGDALPALLCLFVAFIDLFGYWQIRFLAAFMNLPGALSSTTLFSARSELCWVFSFLKTDFTCPMPGLLSLPS